MAWLRHLALFFVFVTAFLRTVAASAFAPAGPASSQARVGAFELVAILVAPATAPSPAKLQGFGAAYDEQASGYRFGAGGPKVGSARLPGAWKRSAEGTKDAGKAQAGGKCVFCRRDTTRTLGGAQRNTDDVIPKARGGNETLDNAQDTRRDCNLDRGTRTTQEYFDMLRQGRGG